MTLAQLKRHMDRRFDRLERTKADKADLRRFARKGDLRRFATKDDLQRFATKDDLQRFATKDDLGQLEMRVTRQFGEVARQFESLGDKIDQVLGLVRLHYTHFMTIADEHEHRLRDLETRLSG